MRSDPAEATRHPSTQQTRSKAKRIDVWSTSRKRPYVLFEADRALGDRTEPAQQKEADEDGDPAGDRRQQARHEAAEEEEGEQHDQRHGQQLRPAQVGFAPLRNLVVCDRAPAERDVRVIGEGREEALPDLLLLLVVQRPERRDQMGRAAVAPDHGGVVGGPPVEDGRDRVAAQLRLRGSDRALRARMLERSLEPHQRHDTARGVGAQPVLDQLARLRAAEPATSNPRGLRCSRTLMPSGAAITVTAIATARTRQGWRLTRSAIRAKYLNRPRRLAAATGGCRERLQGPNLLSRDHCAET